MADDDMRKAFDYYLAHQDEIVTEHDGKVIVIVGEEVVWGIRLSLRRERRLREAAEFDIMGVPFEERGPLTSEQVKVIRTLWTSGHPTCDGRFTLSSPAFSRTPTPCRPHIRRSSLAAPLVKPSDGPSRRATCL